MARSSVTCRSIAQAPSVAATTDGMMPLRAAVADGTSYAFASQGNHAQIQLRRLAGTWRCCA